MGETPGSVVTLLCSGMHFFNAEKRIADCVLEDTAGVAAMTSAELAHCSSTSEATVTRFCKKLGFENYRAFQLALARDVMERQPLEISNEVQLDNIPQSLQNILSNKIDEMSATINGINPENLQRGADPAVERALGVCSGVCRTDLVRRHRGSASCEKPVRHGKADPDDTGVLSRRCGILPAVRSHRADGVCTDGAEHQFCDSSFRSTGSYLYHDSQTAEDINDEIIFFLYRSADRRL